MNKMKTRVKSTVKSSRGASESSKSRNLPITETLAYKRITKEGYLVDKEDHFQAFLKVSTTDLFSMNNDDLFRVITQFTTLCRMYIEDFKIVSMSYPTETSKQQIFWNSKIKQYQRMRLDKGITEKEAARLKTMLWLASESLSRIKGVEQSLSELSFFIIVYGKNEKAVQKNIEDMIQLGGREIPIRHCHTADEIEKILFRLHNMNTEI